jgi:hypothetical protein
MVIMMTLVIVSTILQTEWLHNGYSQELSDSYGFSRISGGPSNLEPVLATLPIRTDLNAKIGRF